MNGVRKTRNSYGTAEVVLERLKEGKPDEGGGGRWREKVSGGRYRWTNALL